MKMLCVVMISLIAIVVGLYACLVMGSNYDDAAGYDDPERYYDNK